MKRIEKIYRDKPDPAGLYEAVECGISVFEDEFMANIVLPGGQTVGDFMKPQIEQAYISGTIPSMLPMLEGGREQ